MSVKSPQHNNGWLWESLLFSCIGFTTYRFVVTMIMRDSSAAYGNPWGGGHYVCYSNRLELSQEMNERFLKD